MRFLCLCLLTQAVLQTTISDINSDLLLDEGLIGRLDDVCAMTRLKTHETDMCKFYKTIQGYYPYNVVDDILTPGAPVSLVGNLHQVCSPTNRGETGPISVLCAYYDLITQGKELPNDG